MPARLYIRPWLERFARRVEDVRNGGDREATHELRASAARIDVWLRIAGLRTLRDDVRRVRRAAAGVREADVLLADPRSAPIEAWLRERRAIARSALEIELDHESTRALLDALRWLPSTPSSRALEFVAKQRERVRRRARAALLPKAGVADFHALRRALRRLRHALEWLKLPTGSLQALHAELGALNDAAALLEQLALSPQAEHLAELRAELARDVSERTRRAKAACRRAKLDARGRS